MVPVCESLNVALLQPTTAHNHVQKYELYSEQQMPVAADFVTIDIGGTHIRHARVSTAGTGPLRKYKHTLSTSDDLLVTVRRIFEHHLQMMEECDTLGLVLAIAGIVERNVVVSATNMPFLNGLEIQKHHIHKRCAGVVAINDADAALIGDMDVNGISPHSNILHIICGTGVGCSLWLNGMHLRNGEGVLMFEHYLGGRAMSADSAPAAYAVFRCHVASLVEMLNLDIIILNGFIVRDAYYRSLFGNLEEDIDVRAFYKRKLRVVLSTCEEPVVAGCAVLATKARS